jgi:hypothetical protein
LESEAVLQIPSIRAEISAFEELVMTGSHAFRIVCLTVIAAAGLVGVLAAERPPIERNLDKFDLEPVIQAEASEDVRSDEEVAEAETTAGSDCDFVGAYVQIAAPAGSRYRGNVYRISPGAPAVLSEIKMELQISGSATLHFTVHERIPDSAVFEHIGTITVPNIVGTGFPAFHSSGVIPGGVELLGNREYAIGVAWGATASVRWGWLNVNQPQAISVGEAIGGVGLNNIASPPDSVSGDLNLSPITSTTLYSMQVCFERAPGACCRPTGCEEVFEEACTGFGAYFHGGRTRCDDTPCLLGACCSPCANECIPDYPPQACEREFQGTHFAGRPCPGTAEGREALCPVVTGACCTGAGTLCAETCRLECSGVYRGDGTTCEPNICVGACCDGGDCFNVPGTFCSNVLQGTFRGDGTQCALLTPGQTCGGGACCSSVGEVTGCVQVATRSLCTEANGFPNAIYLGDGVQCPTQPNTCPAIDDASVGACCLPHGQCINTNDEEFCESTAVGGVFDGTGRNCSESGQSCVTRPCCFASGSCSLLVPASCVNVGGAPVVSQQNCSEATCDLSVIPQKACCLPDGTCEVERRSVCLDAGGKWQEELADCGSASCVAFGACCLPDGNCVEGRSEIDCEMLADGLYQGDGSTCADEEVVCEDTRRGCCTSGGRCVLVTQVECESLPGAIIRPDVEDCQESDCGACCRDDGACDDIVAFECDGEADIFTPQRYCDALEPGECTGIQVCCLGDGDCAELRLAECEAEGGVSQGDVDVELGFTCLTADVCTAGSCCVNGTCEESDEFAFELSCLAAGGTFNMESCAARPCDPRGACCIDGTCVADQFEDVCENDGGVFQGDGTNCTGRVCGGCCVNESCSETLDNLCEGDFHPGVTCDDRPCDPRGACCMGGACFPNQLEDVCIDMGGVYEGDDAACTATRCNLVACCRLSGVCEDVVRSQCPAPDTFTVGTDCASTGCQPRGACCVDGECTHLTQQSCALQEGDYAGNGVACGENSCIPAACCVPDNEGICEFLNEAACLSRDGFYQTGLTCGDEEVDCTRGACCELSGTCTNFLIANLCPETATFAGGMFCAELDCRARGACCIAGDEACHILTRDECIETFGSTYAGNAVPCVEDFCAVGACCFDDGSCEDLTLQQCGPIGFYSGGGTSCAIDGCCVFFDDSDPAPCAIDAGSPDDGLRPAWDSFNILYNCIPQDVPTFTVRVVPDGPAPSVIDVALIGDVATVTLSEPIKQGKWTCIAHTETGQEVCFGSLPGDVNGDGTANAGDLTSLVDHLSDGPALELHGCDVDRSNLCAPPDIITLIDALNHGWMGQSLPACPSLP